jgi:hypothetical protein
LDAGIENVSVHESLGVGATKAPEPDAMATVRLDAGIEYVSVHELPGAGLTRPPEPDAMIRTIPTAIIKQIATINGLWFIPK